MRERDGEGKNEKLDFYAEGWWFSLRVWEREALKHEDKVLMLSAKLQRE